MPVHLGLMTEGQKELAVGMLGRKETVRKAFVERLWEIREE